MVAVDEAQSEPALSPLAPLLALIQNTPPRDTDLIVLEAILFALLANCSWKNLDQYYPDTTGLRPPWQRVHRTYRHWASNDKLANALFRLGETELLDAYVRRSKSNLINKAFSTPAPPAQGDPHA